MVSKATKGYFDERDIPITAGYKKALKNLIIETLLMIRKAEPDNAECWTWGQCIVGDLAHRNAISFTYGGHEDKPKYMRGVARVIIKAKK